MSEWNNKVKRILKSELVKRGLSTEDLKMCIRDSKQIITIFYLINIFKNSNQA